MRYTYLVGTKEQLNCRDGAEFTDYREAEKHANEYNEGILRLEWEYSDSELILEPPNESDSEDE